jgi:hypothetical protein
MIYWRESKPESRRLGVSEDAQNDLQEQSVKKWRQIANTGKELASPAEEVRALRG